MKHPLSRKITAAKLGRLALLLSLALGSMRAEEARASLGDAAWIERAKGSEAGRALPGPALAMVDAYESELNALPESLEAHWKLLRALHFAGDFTPLSTVERRDIFDRSVDVSDAGLALLSAAGTSDAPLDEMNPGALAETLVAAGFDSSNIARFHFWSAINWGARSRSTGLLDSVQQGVANRMHRYASIAVELEPGYEEGGALRLLGRMHAQLPRVPFISGWVDRNASVPILERAHRIAPAHPGNRFLLGLTLFELVPERRAEALEHLDSVANLTPRPTMRVEDLMTRAEARRKLEALRSEGT